MNNLFKKETTEFSDREKISWLRLFRTENVGPVTFFKLLERYGTAAKALEALPELSKRGGRLLQAPPVSDIEREMESLEKIGGKFLFAREKNYPVSLAAIEDAPPVISIFGNPGFFRKSAIGIVGARNASLNGKKFAEKIARELGQSGQVIVSGLARGIDTAAHAGSIDTGTIAVVAGGLDIIYPPENTALYERIKHEGVIVAESPLSMEPLARHFPKRNRLISGLSSGIAVVEASLKSGSLITARMAAEQGRDVYAVPGFPLDPRAEGPNKLIQDGATLVRNAHDILQNLIQFSGGKTLQDSARFDWVDNEPAEPEIDTETARATILENISQTPVAVDELIRACQLSVSAVQMALLELELAGRVQRLPGNRVVLLT